MVGVLPSMRSVAAKTSATLKITVAAVATTEPQAKATMTAIPLCPRASATGPATMANAITAVMVAMTGSQIICRSCRNRRKDAGGSPYPLGCSPPSARPSPWVSTTSGAIVASQSWCAHCCASSEILRDSVEVSAPPACVVVVIRHRDESLATERREWDLNPRRLAPRSFSRAVHSSALPSLQAAHAR